MHAARGEVPRWTVSRHVRALRALTVIAVLSTAGLNLIGCGSAGNPGVVTPAPTPVAPMTTPSPGQPATSSAGSRSLGTTQATTSPTGSPGVTKPATATTTPGATEPTALRRTRAATTTTPGVIRPVLTFNDRTVRFERPFVVRLQATASPPVPVVFRALVGDEQGINDAQCRVEGDRLLIGDPPSLSAACVVEASIPPAPGRVPPPPVQSVVTIGFPQFNVSVPPVPPVEWHRSGGEIEVVIHEDSGDAYGMWVSTTDGECTAGEPSPRYRAPAGTTAYRVIIALPDPRDTSYTCAFMAWAVPQDIAGGVASREFTVRVTP